MRFGQGKVEYHMRAFDSGDSSHKRWIAIGQPDRIGYYAPPPVGTYSDFQVERTVELETRYEPYVHRWNEKDVSQFEQVVGNGLGGVGTPGDWTIEFDQSFSDAPMIKITNVTGVSGAAPAADAIWLFNDFEGGLPERFYAGWRNTWITSNVADLGLILYYEDTTHYFSAWRNSGTTYILHGRGFNGGDFYVAGQWAQIADTDAQRDTVNGDAIGLTAWWRKATSEQLPAISMRGGGPFDPTYQGTGLIAQETRYQAFHESDSDASWNSLSGYRPRIGIFARGGGVVGSDYIGGLTFYRAFGGV